MARIDIEQNGIIVHFGNELDEAINAGFADNDTKLVGKLRLESSHNGVRAIIEMNGSGHELGQQILSNWFASKLHELVIEKDGVRLASRPTDGKMSKAHKMEKMS